MHRVLTILVVAKRGEAVVLVLLTIDVQLRQQMGERVLCKARPAAGQNAACPGDWGPHTGHQSFTLPSKTFDV